MEGEIKRRGFLQTLIGLAGTTAIPAKLHQTQSTGFYV